MAFHRILTLARSRTKGETTGQVFSSPIGQAELKGRKGNCEHGSCSICFIPLFADKFFDHKISQSSGHPHNKGAVQEIINSTL